MGRRGRGAIRSRDDPVHGDLRRSSRSDPVLKELAVTAEAEFDERDVASMARRLGQLNGHAFAEALATNVMQPDALETAAFRSAELAERSLTACRFLLAEIKSKIERREGESRSGWLRRADHYRNRVGMERRLLEVIVAGERAQRGLLATPPNPRGRAMRRLAGMYPQQFLALVREEQAADREAAAQKKRVRRAARAAGVAR